MFRFASSSARRFLLPALAAALALALLAGCGSSSSSDSTDGDTATTGTVTGYVVTAGDFSPLSGVLVAVVGTSRSAVTDALGAFTITSVPAGTRTLSFTLSGYESTTR